MDVIIKLRNRLECKINYTLPALLPNKINTMQQGPATSGEGIRNKRAIPALAIIQGVAAIGGMMIKGINALVDAKRALSFNNAIKLIIENVQITHDRLITLENRTAMMAKAIIPVLKDFKQQINNTNDRLNRQYRMMTKAHDRYNRLFRQTHKSTQDFNKNKEKISQYIKYAENWQVASVICSYTAMACDVLLIVAMIVFLLKYRKTMQAMLVAFFAD